MTEKICAHCEIAMEPTEWQLAMNEDVKRRGWTCVDCKTYTVEESPRRSLPEMCTVPLPKLWETKTHFAKALDRALPNEVIIAAGEYDRLKAIDKKLQNGWLLIAASDYAKSLDISAETPMQLARMETDIGKLRAYLGSKLFDDIVSGEVKAAPRTPSPWRNPVGNWRGPMR